MLHQCNCVVLWFEACQKMPSNQRMSSLDVVFKIQGLQYRGIPVEEPT